MRHPPEQVASELLQTLNHLARFASRVPPEAMDHLTDAGVAVVRASEACRRVAMQRAEQGLP